MKEAKRQAEAVEADKRQAETMKTLAESAKLKKQAAKDLTIRLEAAENALKEFIESIPVAHQMKAITTQNKVNKLLLELKNGADVNDIVKKLNELRV